MVILLVLLNFSMLKLESHYSEIGVSPYRYSRAIGHGVSIRTANLQKKVVSVVIIAYISLLLRHFSHLRLTKVRY